uniref:Uncharacterized protein n=1 Tax=Arundo donax TaxID=35708 RepID=A0A0A9EAW9_ARUDO
MSATQMIFDVSIMKCYPKLVDYAFHKVYKKDNYVVEVSNTRLTCYGCISES